MTRKRTPKRKSTLDSQAGEAVRRFVRVLARGCKPKDIADAVLKECREIPIGWTQPAKAATREIDAAAHVVTLWFSEPAYLDPSGNPRPLSLYGRGLSLESLVKRADRDLETKEVLRHLNNARALRRVGTRYVPRDRLLLFRRLGASYDSRSLRGLLALLRTLQHNSAPGRATPSWFEAFALNPRFPVKERAGFDKRVRAGARRLLFQFDADMHRRERRRKKGERTVPLGVAIYLFEEQPLRGQSRRRRSKRSSK